MLASVKKSAWDIDSTNRSRCERGSQSAAVSFTLAPAGDYNAYMHACHLNCGQFTRARSRGSAAQPPAHLRSKREEDDEDEEATGEKLLGLRQGGRAYLGEIAPESFGGFSRQRLFLNLLAFALQTEERRRLSFPISVFIFQGAQFAWHPRRAVGDLTQNNR